MDGPSSAATTSSGGDDADPDLFDSFMTPSQTRTVTVTFTTQDGKIFTQSYLEKTTVDEVKSLLVDVFAVPASTMDLKLDGRSIENHKKLGDFDLGLYSKLEFGLYSIDLNYVISAEKVYQDVTVPDVITVRIEGDEGLFKEVVVEIEDRSIVKPYLGGFVDRKTGIEYHHGYSQTGPPKPKVPVERQSHRDTQTSWLRNRKMETTYSRATQMSNEEIWIPNVTDRLLTTGKYETADELERRLNRPQKILTIQRYFRAWKMRKALKALGVEYRKRVALELEEEERNARADADRKKRELIGKVFPRTKGDFSMLYSMLDRWKKAELQRITSMACGPSKIAEMYLLLEKEIAMLQSIEHHRKEVQQDMKVQKVEDFFRTIGDPLEWNSDYKNLPCAMDTLETQKGREYEQLYKAICDRSLGKECYIRALLDVKAILQDHNCVISNELLGLIDRACVLMARGLGEKHLEVLRMRIEALFLKHVQMPECSFGVTDRLTRVTEKLMEGDLFYCIRCRSLKTHDMFPLHSRLEKINVCRACAWDDKLKEPWIDIAPYRFILRCVRREERLKSSHSSIVYILQDKDVHHIVANIWHSHSAINECADIYQLRLCRWFKEEVWAPWNCVLLTSEEAKAHLQVRKLDEVYDPEFLHHVYNKHSLAKKHFSLTLQLENYFQEIGKLESRWDEIIESRRFVPVNSKTKVFLSCH